ncbi:MAG: NUDIX hydrolase [Armatimonadetes bacterium]|nr:NUDIX hydrolase [Armatimonadota bacterium]
MSTRVERIGTRRVHDGRVLRLDVDLVRLPGGGESVREVIRHHGAVVIVPLRDDGQVVMVRQFRYAAGEELLELPAGTLGPGEEPLACAKRELAEETGHAAREWRLLASFFSSPGFCDELLHCYLAEGAAPGATGHQDEDEDCKPVLLPLAEARAMARRGELHDAKTIAGLLLLD